ncbi:MAG: hypothetical protein Ta2A_01670 [Treponemataceae bacterium]|nr:MAG: hypothetical protein Ta2A_01670 [Treponemataceae bacterium]
MIYVVKNAKKVLLTFAVFCIGFSAFAQKTEFKLGAGFGGNLDFAFNNFFTDSPKWTDISGGASVFFDANYALLDIDFWWGSHNTFGFDGIKYAQNGATYNLFAQYPMDYVGGRSFVLLGVGYRNIFSVSHKSGTELHDRNALLKKHKLDSLWLKIGVGDHKSLTDLLYLKYQIVGGVRLWGKETQVNVMPEIKMFLGFWIK